MTPEAARRKLGENDPGRYEISVLVGPCSLSEAEQLMEAVADLAEGQLGASIALSTWDEASEAELSA